MGQPDNNIGYWQCPDDHEPCSTPALWVDGEILLDRIIALEARNANLEHDYAQVCRHVEAALADYHDEREKVERYKELAAALDDMTIAYRIGSQSRGAKAADRVKKARAAIAESAEVGEAK